MASVNIDSEADGSSNSRAPCCNPFPKDAFKEMASFFKTDENWKQGEEMNLIELDEKKNFSKKTLNSILNKSNKRLIFIYDFLALWTFFIEVIEFTQPIKNTSYPNLIFSKGKIPKKPPNNIFINSKEKDQTENFDDLSDSELY